MPGDAVPECVDWKQQILGSHISLGWIVTKDQYDLCEAGEKDRFKQLKKKKDAERARRAKASTESLERPAGEEKPTTAGDGEIVDDQKTDDAPNDQNIPSHRQWCTTYKAKS